MLPPCLLSPTSVRGAKVLSKFGRVCPVTWRDQRQCVTCPVDYTLRFAQGIEIHEWVAVEVRCFVYFVRGRLNALQFRRNPCLYLSTEVPHIPVTMHYAIIGPPKVW